MDHLGEELKAFRDKKGWTQPQMADYLSIGYRTYQSIEKHGEVKLVTDLMKILRGLGKNMQMFAQPVKDSLTASDGDVLGMILANSNETNLLVKAALAQRIGYGEAIAGALDKVAKNPEGTTALVAGTIEQRIWKLMQEKGIDAIVRR